MTIKYLSMGAFVGEMYLKTNKPRAEPPLSNMVEDGLLPGRVFASKLQQFVSVFLGPLGVFHAGTEACTPLPVPRLQTGKS